ncbi:MAG: GTP-binding protein [Candidatus Lokiarchaeota archaeon]|nr:GTP-binding protein [Candidatus Lokiarchaeota archaeon]
MATYKLKMLLLGAAAVGKTSLIQNFIKGKFQKEYKMTIGTDIFTKDVVVNIEGEEIPVTLSIWDIAGQERFSFFRTSFYKGASGAMMCFDLTRYETFNPGIVNWLKELWGFTGKIPIVIIGNKNDLQKYRAVRDNDAEKFAKKIPCKYIETSAKTGDHVEDAFYSIALEMVKLMREKDKAVQ